MLIKRINNRRAFTLSETLVAVLIMLMVSSILAAGMPAVKAAYEKVVLKSNAEIFMSTTVYALRNELSVASNIKVDDNGAITYISGTYGSGSKIYVDINEGIMYQRYAKTSLNKDSKENVARRLVSESASDKLIIKYDTENKPVVGDGFITIKNLIVYRVYTTPKGSVQQQLLKREKLSIMTI